MKKNVFLLLFSLLLGLTSCDEKKLLDDIQGVWSLGKYEYNSQDKTLEFNTQHPNYRWVFRGDKTFSQFWDVAYDSVGITLDTTYPNGQLTVDTTWQYYPRTGQAGISGTWVLINSNKYLQTTENSGAVNQYKILKHSESSLSLFKGNETFYLNAE